MSAALPFAKYEGTGNDFVVLEGDAAARFDERSAPRLCDRHFGVGADGVLLILPGGPGAVATMRVINADGSAPEMCGNGLRCVALAVSERAGVDPASVVIDTGAGRKLCSVQRAVDVAQVTVDMGEVRYLEARELIVGGTSVTVHKVDAGNPHAILFAPQAPSERARLGPLLETNPEFASRTNVEFAEVDARGIALTVWERGVGFTLACGTGACAAAVAAWQLGLVQDARVEVRLPGGPLIVERAQEAGRVIMTGPARRVFDGSWLV